MPPHSNSSCSRSKSAQRVQHALSYNQNQRRERREGSEEEFVDQNYESAKLTGGCAAKMDSIAQVVPSS